MNEGAVPGKPNYVIIYGDGCFNSKRQARRTVSLYEKYKDRVNFVVVDLDQKRSPTQQQLVKQYYQGYIPHVVVLDKSGRLFTTHQEKWTNHRYQHYWTVHWSSESGGLIWANYLP